MAATGPAVMEVDPVPTKCIVQGVLLDLNAIDSQRLWYAEHIAIIVVVDLVPI